MIRPTGLQYTSTRPNMRISEYSLACKFMCSAKLTRDLSIRPEISILEDLISLIRYNWYGR